MAQPCHAVPAAVSKNRRKYRNQPTVYNGIRFDSKREAARYADLLLVERAGEIANLELQPVFPLVIDGVPVKIRSPGRPNGTRCKYTADFRYLDLRTNTTVVEDTKGIDTQASRLRRAVIECIYGIKIDLI